MAEAEWNDRAPSSPHIQANLAGQRAALMPLDMLGQFPSQEEVAVSLEMEHKPPASVIMQSRRAKSLVGVMGLNRKRPQGRVYAASVPTVLHWSTSCH